MAFAKILEKEHPDDACHLNDDEVVILPSPQNDGNRGAQQVRGNVASYLQSDTQIHEAIIVFSLRHIAKFGEGGNLTKPDGLSPNFARPQSP